jgi:hypothetical protein
MNKLNGKYEEVMEFVFALKEKASEEARGMKFKQYLKHIKKVISGIEGRFEEKKVKAA